METHLDKFGPVSSLMLDDVRTFLLLGLNDLRAEGFQGNFLIRHSSYLVRHLVSFSKWHLDWSAESVGTYVPLTLNKSNVVCELANLGHLCQGYGVVLLKICILERITEWPVITEHHQMPSNKIFMEESHGLMNSVKFSFERTPFLLRGLQSS